MTVPPFGLQLKSGSFPFKASRLSGAGVPHNPCWTSSGGRHPARNGTEPDKRENLKKKIPGPTRSPG